MTTVSVTSPLTDTAAASVARPMPLSLKLGWALGTLSSSTGYAAVSVLLLGYLVNSVGLGASVAGLLFGAMKLFDAIADPAIGVLSDKTRSRLGRRRPFLLVGTVVSAVSFWALFSIPNSLSGLALAVFVGAVMLLNAAGYALFVIPYLAMPAEMTTERKERTQLMSLRVSAASLGQIIGTFVGPLIISAGGGGHAGHANMSIVVALIILVLGLASFFGTSKAKFTVRAEAHQLGMGQFKTAFQNRHFTILMGIKLASLLYVSTTLVIMPFVFTQILHQPYSTVGYFFLAKSAAMILSQPLWVRVTARFDRFVSFAIGCGGLAVTALAWLFFTDKTPIPFILGLGFCTGMATGAVLLIGQALLPDAIEQDFKRTGLRREGVFAGVYTAVERISMALAASLTGLILGAFGYIASKTGPVAQPPSAIFAIHLCLVLTAIYIVASAVIMRFYPKDGIKE